MGGKSSVPPPPDYSSIAAASKDAADMNYKLGHESLEWGKQQYDQVWPYAKQYLQQQIDTTTDERARAKDQTDFYNTTYKPMEAGLAKEANEYNSPARSDANAGRAMGDVASAFDQNRAAALSSLEGYGIDPSETRFGALDLGTRIAQAASTAAAGTQSRLNTEATATALKSEMVNVGRGYPGATAQAYATATGAGSAGLGSANQTSSTMGSLRGSPQQYMGLGNQALGTGASIANSQGQYGLGVMNSNNAVAANNSAGIGQLAGAAVGIGAIAI